MTRYDTQAPFSAAGSWSSFAVQSVAPAVGAMRGAVFDARYVYFSGGTIVARFDTKSPPSMPQLPAFHGSFF